MLIGLGMYVFLAAACIIFVSLHEQRGQDWKHPVVQRLRLAVPLILQLSFGSLLSMAFLFYWFSGTWSVSWPIFAILIGLILFNEAFRHIYLRPFVQVTFFSFVLFTYSSILFPYLFNSLSSWVVFIGDVTSLALSMVLIWILTRISPKLYEQRWRIAVSVMSVFCVLNILYRSNLIPPIPLSLRDAGMYHDVHREGDTYTLTGEPESWWEHLLPGQTIHLATSNERVYAYTSIYSPTDLDITIYHRWEYFSPETRTWEMRDRLSFGITGGRGDGYRGYTFKTNLDPGRWRVTVETARGQVLGRIGFTIIAAP